MNQFIKLIALQNIAGILSLAGAIIVFAVVIFLMVTSNKNIHEKSADNSFRKGDRYFWGIILLLIFTSLISLRLLPDKDYKGKADEVVTVVGVQWDWLMAVGESNQNPERFIGKNEISVPVNKRIKFIVTSGDVTHNFAIYTQKGELLTQIQAMPQYKNGLDYIFTRKGKYTILCLEYCGLAHPFMTAIIHVY